VSDVSGSLVGLILLAVDHLEDNQLFAELLYVG